MRICVLLAQCIQFEDLKSDLRLLCPDMFYMRSMDASSAGSPTIPRHRTSVSTVVLILQVQVTSQVLF